MKFILHLSRGHSKKSESFSLKKCGHEFIQLSFRSPKLYQLLVAGYNRVRRSPILLHKPAREESAALKNLRQYAGAFFN